MAQHRHSAAKAGEQPLRTPLHSELLIGTPVELLGSVGLFRSHAKGGYMISQDGWDTDALLRDI